MTKSLPRSFSSATEERNRTGKGEQDGPFKPGAKESYLFKRAQEVAREEQDNASSNRGSTHIQEEVDKFRSLAGDWWDPEGPCRPLHSLNTLRVPLVRDGLARAGRISHQTAHDSPRPLDGVSILDVGCGGGVLAEALARLGANVTGLDAAEENVAAARQHADLDPAVAGRLSYEAGSVEDLAASKRSSFDAVVASEVLEHVDDQDLFVKSCADLVPSGGSLFFTTLNRNRPSYLAGVVAAECLLGLLPVGTHDWHKFVKPEELDAMLSAVGCQTRVIHGMFYWPLHDQWTWIPQATVNYALHAVKK